MNIRAIVPMHLLPTFINTSVNLLDILVKGALTFTHAVIPWRRGKCTGVLVRLCRSGHRSPLPGIFLSNVLSLCNKLDELQLLVGKNRDLTSSFILCFMETWLCGLITDSELQQAGFQLFRVDHDMELSGKTKVGGICFYTNSG